MKNQNVTRRNFLQILAVGSSSTVLAACSRSATNPKIAPSTPTKPIDSTAPITAMNNLTTTETLPASKSLAKDSLATKLWQANQDLAQESLQNPFIRGLADGTLPQKAFAYFVSQDTFFLEALARAYSLVAVKAPDWEGFQTFHALVEGLIGELKNHDSYAAKWGVDNRKAKAGAATRRYTDFLLTTAWGQEAGVAAAAMAPCDRLYTFIGQELAKNGIPNHAYSDWIRTYSSPETEEYTLSMESFVDKYANPSPLIDSVYRYAMECERDFFQAAWEARS